MAGAGKKTFTAGEVLTASDVNTYLMEQSVMVFGGTAARSSAIPTPSEGMTTYRTDTNQIESYNGSAWVGMSGLQLIKTQTIGSGVTSVTVTGAFSADYDNYKIVVSGGAGSLGGASLHLQLGASTTGYAFGSGYSPYTGGNPISYSSSTGTTKFLDIASSGTNYQIANIEIQSPFLARFTTVASVYPYNGGNVNYGGIHNVASSYTDFTFTTASGTTTGGTIYVYGYAKG